MSGNTYTCKHLIRLWIYMARLEKFNAEIKRIKFRIASVANFSTAHGNKYLKKKKNVITQWKQF